MIQKNNKCLFYASNYHFEMICMSHIAKCSKENKEVVMLSESDLQESISKILNNMKESVNKKENVKLCKKMIEKISNIDWKNDNNLKIENLKNQNSNVKVVFVKGNSKFIEDVNNQIKNIENIEIVNCYDINEVENNISQIAKKYNSILVTSGLVND